MSRWRQEGGKLGGERGMSVQAPLIQWGQYQSDQGLTDLIWQSALLLRQRQERALRRGRWCREREREKMPLSVIIVWTQRQTEIKRRLLSSPATQMPLAVRHQWEKLSRAYCHVLFFFEDIITFEETNKPRFIELLTIPASSAVLTWDIILALLYISHSIRWRKKLLCFYRN